MSFPLQEMMRLRKARLHIIVILGTILLFGHVPCAFANVVIIVNKNNPVKAVKRGTVASYFLKKSTSWDTGARVVPIDLTAKDPARQEFSEWILKKSAKSVEEHWIGESLTGGKSAPDIVGDATLAKKRVAAELGAIGYIDNTALDSSVKAVEVVE